MELHFDAQLPGEEDTLALPSASQANQFMNVPCKVVFPVDMNLQLRVERVRDIIITLPDEAGMEICYYLRITYPHAVDDLEGPEIKLYNLTVSEFYQFEAHLFAKAYSIGLLNTAVPTPIINNAPFGAPTATSITAPLVPLSTVVPNTPPLGGGRYDPSPLLPERSIFRTMTVTKSSDLDQIERFAERVIFILPDMAGHATPCLTQPSVRSLMPLVRQLSNSLNHSDLQQRVAEMGLHYNIIGLLDDLAQPGASPEASRVIYYLLLTTCKMLRTHDNQVRLYEARLVESLNAIFHEFWKDDWVMEAACKVVRNIALHNPAADKLVSFGIINHIDTVFKAHKTNSRVCETLAGAIWGVLFRVHLKDLHNSGVNEMIIHMLSVHVDDLHCVIQCLGALRTLLSINNAEELPEKTFDVILSALGKHLTELEVCSIAIPCLILASGLQEKAAQSTKLWDYVKQMYIKYNKNDVLCEELSLLCQQIPRSVESKVILLKAGVHREVIKLLDLHSLNPNLVHGYLTVLHDLCSSFPKYLLDEGVMTSIERVLKEREVNKNNLQQALVIVGAYAKWNPGLLRAAIHRELAQYINVIAHKSDDPKTSTVAHSVLDLLEQSRTIIVSNEHPDQVIHRVPVNELSTNPPSHRPHPTSQTGGVDYSVPGPSTFGPPPNATHPHGPQQQYPPTNSNAPPTTVNQQPTSYLTGQPNAASSTVPPSLGLASAAHERPALGNVNPASTYPGPPSGQLHGPPRGETPTESSNRGPADTQAVVKRPPPADSQAVAVGQSNPSQPKAPVPPPPSEKKKGFLGRLF